MPIFTETFTSGSQQSTVQASFKALYETSSNVNAEGHKAYRLLVSITEAQNISDGLFVYESVPPSPVQPDGAYSFVTVATPEHLESMPMNVATPESSYMCRRNEVDLIFTSASMLLRTRRYISMRLKQLAEGIEALAQMQADVEEEATFESPE
ncbi:MAG: hypothetical protein WC214_07545 [Candidatus Omnitrophota bacterium]